MPKTLAAAILALLLLPSSALAAGRPRAASGRSSAGVLTVPVSFSVRNENRSRVACATDGRRYTVRGHLVAPRSALTSRRRAVTLYLHGLGFGEFFWRFRAVPGYDYATEQAKAGHASIVIDRLGYDKSGRPVGTRSCLGAQADVAHQIVGELRSGRFRAGSRAGTRFRKVVLAGHSAGGTIAQIEAYSFKDIDGLIVVSFSDRGASSFTTSTFAQTGAICAAGGQRADGHTGPPGYAFFGQSDQDARRAFFFNADSRVVDATLAMRNRDPCGDTGSFPQAMSADEAFVPRITVPVLLVFGDHDALFPPPAGRQQRSMYTGTRDVKLVTLRNTAHAVTLERTRRGFRATVSRFLRAHGFTSAVGPRFTG